MRSSYYEILISAAPGALSTISIMLIKLTEFFSPRLQGPPFCSSLDLMRLAFILTHFARGKNKLVVSSTVTSDANNAGAAIVVSFLDIIFQWLFITFKCKTSEMLSSLGRNILLQGLKHV